MAKIDPDKRAKRNAAKRLNYWVKRRLKDIIFRRSQLDSWRETTVQAEEARVARMNHNAKRSARKSDVTVETRAA